MTGAVAEDEALDFDINFFRCKFGRGTFQKCAASGALNGAMVADVNIDSSTPTHSAQHAQCCA
jgi:hypothetical protein